MNWLITGGCGFIGTSLIDSLVRLGGHNIRVMDNLSVGTKEDLARVCSIVELDAESDHYPPLSAGICQFIKGDILNENFAVRVTRDIDIIVHLAANTGVAPSVENPRNDCLSNVIGTLNYLEAARINSVSRFIFASSGAPVGEVTPPIHEEIAPHPVSPYGASKLAGEGYCSAYYRTYGLETVALRFGNVYGPMSTHKNSVIAKFIKRTLNGEELEIYGNGKQTRDFIHIADLIDAILRAASQEYVGGHIFQIATGTEVTIDELSLLLATLFEEKGFTDIKLMHSAPRSGDVMRNYADTSKALRFLGWKPKILLEQGLRETIDWYIANSSSVKGAFA